MSIINERFATVDELKTDFFEGNVFFSCQAIPAYSNFFI